MFGAEVYAPKTVELQEDGVTYQFVPWRAVSAETMRFYDVAGRVNAEGRLVALAAPFGTDAKQIRLADEKKIWWQGRGSDADLFGIERFESGGKSVTIYEGWLDACSGFEIIKSPCISVRSATSARKDCTRQFDKLNSFERIVLCFDSDEPGQKAAEEVAGLFDFNKVYQVKMSRKDCNSYMWDNVKKELVHDENSFRQAWYAAKRFLPEGILSSKDDFHKILSGDVAKESVPYPFTGWNAQTDGIRSGEFTLLSADEGVGKTEVLRAIEYHLLSTTPFNVGTVHLEEDKARQLKGLAGYALGIPAHLKDAPVSQAEIEAAVDVFADRLHLYSHFDSDDPDCILDRIRFMGTACDCKYIFLDHIGLLVSGLETDDERRKLDYLSTKLAYMVRKNDFSLFVAAHVNAQGNIRGSTYPSKVAHTWLHLTRNLVADNDVERNSTFVTIKKNRYTGKTGPVGCLSFSPETFKITEAQELPV